MKNWETLEPDQTMLLTTHYTPGRSGRRIDKILVHHNSGPLSIEGCWQVWQTRAASAHYQVDAAGRIGRLVNDADTAWHAGDWDANTTSIGIEHADITSQPWTISEATLDNGAHLVAALCHHYGLGRPEWLKNVFPHNHFQATECPASIGGTQRDAYMARAQQYYDQMEGDDMSPEEVWNVNINGVKARDRLIGIDNAANGINNRVTSEEWKWLTGRAYRTMALLKKLCGIKDADTTIPETATVQLSDAQMDQIADKVAARLKDNA
ncbi:peptidoglycan recognition protein family protein [Bifidobacterium callitrichidarum]|uniref:N-acetylmuramoyl-L-alanine amidase n=1 Tax=Bifidobacterium callitrichidarum TaxID=2052941 RepID=A0A2U2N778_9BIFI|nr:peptidoglycan recognition family protein [Bifidobacterium callitrichidarum]PWG65041.1 N-acetylmuramyl-L-alanine amidase [Bifidobacterium callitrichidarum]